MEFATRTSPISIVEDAARTAQSVTSATMILTAKVETAMLLSASRELHATETRMMALLETTPYSRRMLMGVVELTPYWPTVWMMRVRVNHRAGVPSIRCVNSGLALNPIMRDW